MTRKFSLLFFLTILMVAMLTASGWASSYGTSSSNLSRMNQYDLMNHGASILDGASSNPGGRYTPANSLGAFSADGGSPGYIVARTFQDMQTWYGASHRIEWRVGPQMHFTWEQQDIPGGDLTVSANYLMYNAFDPTDLPNGSFAIAGGQPLNPSPFTYITEYPNADVDETGHMIITGHSSDPGADPRPRITETFWDISGAGTYGTFIGDTLPLSETINPAASIAYPKIEYQEYNGQQITHLLVNEFVDPGYITYWRRAGGNGTIQGWTTQVITDSAGPYLEGTITSSREFTGGQGGKVAICWTQNMSNDHVDAGDDWGSDIAYVESTDAGLSWSSPQRILNFDPNEDNEVAWIENYCFYDSEGSLHIVFNTQLFSNGSAGTIDPSRVMHWTDRVAGPNAGGTLTTVAIADFRGLGPMCGRAGTNVLNTGKPLVSECNGRLYTIWQQFGDYDSGDTTDCANPDVLPIYGYNPDLFMSVSLSLDGSLWDASRNLTNSKTPDCDTTVGNECDYDNYPSVSRYGMNTADFSGVTWNAVPEIFQVRDALDAGYPATGYFLDVFFVDDFFPGVPRFSSKAINPDIWTYNPLKWFRLPCVPPVIEPRIFISQPDYTYPENWVKSGQEKSFDVKIENIGNDVLNVTSINANLTGGTPSGAVSITPSALTIVAGGSDLVSVTLNPGGFITASAGNAVPLVADVVFNSNDPKKPQLSFGINTVVADTVVQITWDTVYTGASSSWQLALTVGNNGNAGRAGAAGRVNLDFVNTGLECDTPGASVYLYDISPVVMFDATHYSWQPFYTAGRTNSEYNFQPVPGSAAKHNSGPNFDSYKSEIFVTVDSTVAMMKNWYTPKADVSYAIERIQVFSYDGGTHNDVRIGEWIDWDIPSDTGSNNEGGFVVDPGSVDYMWMRGLEYNPTEDCHDNDRRYGASGLLGYYTASEYAGNDAVNNTGLFGGFVQLDADIFAEGTDATFIPDSAWAFLNRNELSANNAEANDQQIWLSFGSFTVDADTLTLWVVHASMYDGDEAALQTIIDDAEAWYLANRGDLLNPSCCGKYTGGYTGNTDCDTQGKMALADVTKLIDRVYLSKQPLCCEENGNVDGDAQGKMALADITKLIDHIYLSKQPTALCQ